MSANLPPMERGEASVLRSVEPHANRPTVYDAFSDSAAAGHGKDNNESSRPTLWRLVRKVMLEQQSQSPGNDMLKKMREAKLAQKLDDAFQHDVFHEETIIEEEGEDDGDHEQDRRYSGTAGDGVASDVEQVPVDPSTPLLHRDKVRRLTVRKRKQERICCSWAAITSFFLGFVAHCWLLVFAALLAGLALLMYYHGGNPSLDALPGDQSLCWWFNFVARQIVTLEMARVLKFLILDCLVLGVGTNARIVGPFTTLLSLRAQGWPFVLFVRGILDLLLIQGDNEFQNHWLSFTGWTIYSLKENSGLYIIAGYDNFVTCACL